MNATTKKFNIGNFYKLEETQKHSKEWTELKGYEVILRKQEGISETVAIKLAMEETFNWPSLHDELVAANAILRQAIHQNIIIPAIKAGYHSSEKLISSFLEALAYFEMELAELKLTEENTAAFFSQELRNFVLEKLKGKDSETKAKFCKIYESFVVATAKRNLGLTQAQREQAVKLVELAPESRMKVAILEKLQPQTAIETAEDLF